MEPLKRVVLITGSSRGMGAETAKGFAKQGASLCITGLPAHHEELSEVAKACKENGSPQVLEVLADLTIQEDMDSLMNKTMETFGQLDVLVNNAGIITFAGIDQYTSEDFDKVFSINVKAPIYLTKIAKPHLIKTKGNIINMCSAAHDLYSNPQALIYSMSKASVVNFTKNTAAALAKDGIRCNGICPGVIRTQIFDESIEETGREQLFKAEESELANRLATKSEVAHLITFLASDKAAMITGELFKIDGGKSLCR
uniref:Uncharacterized protein n=1 Tax=Ciona savignyi TaxID=51511 RepID=H2Z510_CIOSA